MVKITLEIDGMMCRMCEAHVNECIRENFTVKKVTSSHAKGESVIIADSAPDEEKLRAVIGATGYKLTGMKTEPYEKKGGLFGLFGGKK